MKQVFFFLICISGGAWAQVSSSINAYEELENIRKAYGNIKTMTQELILRSYTGATAAVPHEEMKGKVYINGAMMESIIDGTVTLQNATCKVLVNPADKTIEIYDPAELRAVDWSAGVSIDSYKDICKSLKASELKNGTRKIVFYFLEGHPLSSCEVYYTTGSYVLQKIVMFFSDSHHIDDDPTKPLVYPKAEIVYRNVNFSPVIPSGYFNEGKYVILNGDPKPAAKFKGYQVSDFRTLN